MSQMRRPLFIGIPDIMAGINDMYQPGMFYTLWGSMRDIVFQWNNPDIEAGKQALEHYLERLTESCELYYFKLHPLTKENQFYTGRMPVLMNIPISLNEIADRAVNGVDTKPGSMSYEMFEAMKVLKDLPATLKGHLDTINERLDELESFDEVEPPKDLLGQITGVLENPHLMTLIGGVLQKLVPGLLPQPAAPVQHAISGPNDPKEEIIQPGEEPVIDNELLQKAVDRLHLVCKVDTDLSLLADYAEKNPTMFKMLLETLRKS